LEFVLAGSGYRVNQQRFDAYVFLPVRIRTVADFVVVFIA
jgi:hypothetical protein